VTLGPRGLFAERFALLYAEAGEPPLKRITESVGRARRVDEQGRPVRVPAQRVSDWRRGRNVPAKFSALAVVLDVLIGEARKTRPAPVVDGLYDVDLWRALWEEALASPVLEVRLGTPPDDLAVPPGEDGACPYRGLAVFREEDSGWFFGRQRSTTTLAGKVSAAQSGMVVLVGASGAGKSSLIRAGLVPALDTDVVALMTPTVDPLKELGHRVPELTDVMAAVAAEEPDEEFAERVRAAVRSFAARASLRQARPVLVVDQFEELFTLSSDEGRRRLFVAALSAACTSADAQTPPPARVVLGVRADFYGRCLDYPALAEALQDRQMVLGAMTTAELREAVARPARAVGLQLETGLVELMMSDLGVTSGHHRAAAGQGAYDAGALPLLSHALLATWQRRQAGKLTVAGYRAAGGIQGAVAATAERAWADLDADGQAAAKPVLLRLVRVGQDSQDTRRRATRQEVIEQAANRCAATEALEVLTSARLVTLDADSVEITHEALLHAWPRLRSWIDRDRAGTLVRQRLREDAQSWDAEGRDPSLLYRGARLAAVQHWAQVRGPDALTGVTQDFLTSSVRHRRRTALLSRAAVVLLVVFALLAATTAVVAFRQKEDAQFAQVLAEADRLQASDPSLAAELDVVAHRLRPDDRTVDTRLIATGVTPLAAPLLGHSGAVYLTTFNPAGTVLASASYDRTVRLWDVRDRMRPQPLGKPLTGFGSWVTTAVFSPDGRVLATAGDDHMIRLWDVTRPAAPTLIGHPLTAGDGTIYLLAFNPDGRTLAAANEDHTARLWDVHDPANTAPLGPPLGGHSGQVRSLAFSPDGHTLATSGDDHVIQLWDVTDPAAARMIGQPLDGDTDTVHSLAFSPDGRTLASGSDDRTVRLWDVTDPAAARMIGQPLGLLQSVWSVAFSPDGSVLAAACTDGAAHLWNVRSLANPTQLEQPLAAGGGLFALGFSPDGHALATGSADNSVRLWSLPETVVAAHTGAMPGGGPVFGPGGHMLATTGADGALRLWRLTDGSHPVPIGRPRTEPIKLDSAAAFRPDGNLVAVPSADRTVQLWDIRDPANPVQAGPPIRLPDIRYTNEAEFSPDGRVLATTRTDLSVQLWDVSDPADVTALGSPLTGHSGYVNSFTFSPDGHTLVTGSADRTLRVWDITDPAHAKPRGGPITGHTGAINDVAFDTSGHLLASGADDKTVRLWDAGNLDHVVPVGTPLTGHTKGVKTVAFSPDGRTVVSAASDDTIRLWDTSDPSHATAFGLPMSAYTSTGYTASFDPAGATVATASADGVLRLWPLDVDGAVHRICATTRNVLTPETWRQHIPQLSYRPPCG